MLMKFAEKCPKCKGEVQTKKIKKSIGLGTVDIPIAQFCLNPVCNWYQDFSEAAKPDEIKEDVLQIKIPYIKNKISEIKNRASELINNKPELKKLQLQITELIKQNMLVVKGASIVIVLSILLIWVLHLMQPRQP